MPRSLAEMVRERVLKIINECEKEYNCDEYVADNS